MIPLLLLWACTADKTPLDTGSPPDGGSIPDGGGTDTGTTSPSPVDLDGDGWTSELDCDDGNPAVYPGAVERCNDIDDDCDGRVDDADADVVDQQTFYADADGDGFGDPLVVVVACEVAAGHVENASDCLDSDASVNPDAAEICDDGVDNDCDGGPNDCLLEGTYELSELVGTVWRADDDGCLAAVERGDESTCRAFGVSMVSSLLGGQDLDGDGRADLLVHSPWRSVNLIVPLAAASGAFEDVASAWLSYTEITTGSEVCDGATSFCRGFYSSRAVGDWNGDGFQDLAIGSVTTYYDPVEFGIYGQVVAAGLGPLVGEVDMSSTGSLLVSGDDSDYLASHTFGNSMAAVPAVDGVGDDLVIGSYGCSPGRLSPRGCVYLFEDPMAMSTSLDLDADTVWYYGDDDTMLGEMVENLGDTDGDGIAEVIAFAEGRHSGFTDRGWVVSSADRGWARISDVALGVVYNPDGTGGAGSWQNYPARRDIDGDGLLDLVVATPQTSLSGVDYSGSVYVVPGPFRGEVYVADETWARFDGELTYCYFGENVDLAGAGDSDQTMLSIGGRGRHSRKDSYGVCTDPARIATWYDLQPGVWSEYDADLRINLRVGWEGEPDGRTWPSLLSHAWVDGSMVMVLAMTGAGENADGTDAPGFISLVPLPGM